MNTQIAEALFMRKGGKGYLLMVISDYIHTCNRKQECSIIRFLQLNHETGTTALCGLFLRLIFQLLAKSTAFLRRRSTSP